MWYKILLKVFSAAILLLITGIINAQTETLDASVAGYAPATMVQGGAPATFSVLVKTTTTNISGYKLKVILPAGMQYVPVASGGILAGCTESDITSLEAPVFTVNDIIAPASLKINITARIVCGYIQPSPVTGNGLTFELFKADGTTVSALPERGDAPGNSPAPAFNITSISPTALTTPLNTNGARTITVRNTGPVSVDSLVIEDITASSSDAAAFGVTAVDNGTISAVTNGYRITLKGAALQSAITGGNGDTLFDAGEVLTITLQEQLTSCNKTTVSLQLKAGVTDINDNLCFAYEALGLSISYPIGTPSLRVDRLAGGTYPTFCADGTISYRITNIGIGGNESALYNIAFPWSMVRTDAGFYSAAQTSLVLRSVTVNGVNIPVQYNKARTVPITGLVDSSIIVGLDQLTSDPDGAGGLADLNGDGLFGDLAPGQNFTIVFNYGYDMGTFAPDRLQSVTSVPNDGFGYFSLGTSYTDQCNVRNTKTNYTYTESIIIAASGASPSFLVSSENAYSYSNYINQPALYAGDTSSIIILASTNLRGAYVFDANVTTKTVTISLPDGLAYNPAGAAYANVDITTTPLLDIPAASITVNGKDVTIVLPKATNSVLQSLSIPVIAVDEPIVNKTVGYVANFSYDACPGNDHIFMNQSSVLNYALVSLTCPGIATTGFLAKRVSSGFIPVTTETEAQIPVARADENTPGQNRSAARAKDKIRFTINGKVAGADYAELWARVTYKAINAVGCTGFNSSNPTAFNPNSHFDKLPGGATVVAGTLHVKPAAGNELSCDILVQDIQTAYNAATGLHTMQVNAGGKIGTGLPIDYTLAAGDSIWIEWYMKVSTTNVPYVYQAIPAITGDFYTKDADGIVSDCSDLVTNLFLEKPNYNSNGITQRYSGRQPIPFYFGMITMNPTAINGDRFPNEVRWNTYMNGVSATIAGIWQMDSTYRHYLDVWGTTSNYAFQPADYTVSYSNGNTIVTFTNRPLQANGLPPADAWPMGDMPSMTYEAVRPNWRMIPVCPPNGDIATVSNINVINYYYTDDSTDWVKVNYERTSGPSYTAYTVNAIPTLANVDGVASTVKWQIRLTNTSNTAVITGAGQSAAAPYNWVSFVSPDKGITITRLINKTSGMVYPAESYGAGKYWVKLGDIVKDSIYDVEATYTICSNDKVIYSHGLSPTQYPVDPDAGFSFGAPVCADFSAELHLYPKEVSISAAVGSTANPVQFCTNTTAGETAITDTITVANTASGTAGNLKVAAAFPAGLTVTPGTSKIIWNATTYNISDPVLMNGKYVWALSAANGIDTLPGTASGGNKNIYRLIYGAQTACGFVSGTRIDYTVSGASGCGTESSYLISGVPKNLSMIPPSLNSFFLTTIPDIIIGNNGTPVPYFIRVNNQGPGDAATSDIVKLTVPAGIDIVAGSITPVTNAVNITGTVSNTVDTLLNTRTIVFNMPAGPDGITLKVNDEAEFGFNLFVTNAAAFTPGFTGSMHLTSEFTVPGVTCGATPCNVSFVTGSALSDIALQEIPLALGDTAIATVNTPVAVNVLANDSLGVCTSGISVSIQAGGEPVHGNATINGTQVIYMGSTDYTGVDSLYYVVSDCTGRKDSALLYIRVIPYPDNIDTAHCVGRPSATIWDMKLSYVGPQRIQTYGQPYAGDIDGDGKVEIIALNRAPSQSYGSDSIIVMNDTLGLKYAIPLGQRTGYNVAAGGTTANAGFAFADVDKDGKAELFVLMGTSSANTQLWCYTYDESQTSKWRKKWATAAIPGGGNPGWPVNIGDINNDGIPEIFVYNRVFNAVTGDLLVTLPAGTFGKSVSVGYPELGNNLLADMDNNGTLEAVGGTSVYKIEITNPIGTTGNTASVLYRLPDSLLTGYSTDGFTSVADLDLDGYLDVIVNSKNTAGQVVTYAWNPRTQTLFGPPLIGKTATSDVVSRAFIGDVDGDKYPEVALVYQNGMVCWHMDTVAKNKFLTTPLWRLTSTDASGMTIMTMFDFNQDGKQEIVYRDQDSLRVMDGVTGKNLTTFVCGSPTSTEYPIVVDAHKDGHSVIVVSGYPTPGYQNTAPAYIRMYSSATPGTWAAARAVWNQYSYNVVNINEDLTVPQYQTNPSTLFPGADGVFGTTDDIRPFNGFLQQQTLLDKNGGPLSILADAFISNVDGQQYYHNGDSLTVQLVIGNQGSSSIQNPLRVAVYKESITPGNLLDTMSYNLNVNVDSVVTLLFRIDSLSKYLPVNNLVFRVNDKGSVINQAECDTANNMYTVPLLTLIQVVNDTAITLVNTPVTIPVLNNDSLSPCTIANSNITALNAPLHGTAVIANNKVVYTPAPGYTGRDSLHYEVTSCTGQKDTGTIFIQVIAYPDNIDTANCVGTPPATVWDMRLLHKSSQLVQGYGQPYTGDVDGDGKIEIVILNGKNPPSEYAADSILIFDDTLHVKYTIPLGQLTSSGQTTANAGLALADVNKDGKAEIFILAGTTSSNTALRCYAFNGSGWTQKWTTGAIADLTTGWPVNIGDINNDGIPEILVRDKVFNAVTGQLLLSLPSGMPVGAGAGLGSSMIVGNNVLSDVDNNGTLEAVCGTVVYKLNIVNESGEAGNGASVLYQVPDPAIAGYNKDGFTSVADINLDGYPDVIVNSTDAANSQAVTYAWNPLTQTLYGAPVVNDASGKTSSVPFIGDVDGDGYPEVALSYVYGMVCWHLDTTTKDKFLPTPLWRKSTSDGSGMTVMTMFDFNQDGTQEVVYRDESNIRVMNGATGDNLTTLVCGSPTFTEYPVVADINRDGHAEIIVSGVDSSYVGILQGSPVQLRIYTSETPGAWAPARTVWNQYNYNVVNINEDLTVPPYQANLSSLFPGKDGVFGTADDIRPYNGSFQQQTLRSQEGNPLFLLPDAYISKVAPLYYTEGDSLLTAITIKNQGTAGLQSPVYLSAYNSSVASGNLMDSMSFDINVLPGDSAVVQFRIDSMHKYAPVNGIVYRVNDKGSAIYQKECDTTNNEYSTATTIGIYSWKEVTDSSGDGKVQPGELLTYTIKVIKSGDLPVKGIIISDTLPLHSIYVTGSGGVLSGNVIRFVDTATLDTGKVYSYSFAVRADADLKGVRYIVNQATVTGGGDTSTTSTDSSGSCLHCPTVVPVSGVFTAWKTVADSSGDNRAQAGEHLTYTIHVQNTGGAVIDSIIVRDTLPAHTTYISGGVLTGNVIEFKDTTPLDTGGRRSYSFIVQAAAILSGVDTIRNLAWVSGDNDTIPAGKDSTISCDTCPPPTCVGCPIVMPASSFAAWKTVTDANGDGKATAGEQLTYTIHVQNTGGAALDSIIIRDTLPVHTTYVSGGVLTGNVIEFRDTSPLDTGGRRSYSFIVQAAAILSGVDTIRNLAWISGNNDTIPAGKDSTISCDTCPPPTCVSCPTIIPASSFAAWKTVTDAGGDERAQPGELLTYTIHVQNTGGVVLDSIIVRDTLPAHTTYVSGGILTGNVIEFRDTSPLDTGGRRSYSFVVQAASILTGVDGISNLAWVSGDNDTIPAGKDSTISCDTCPPPTCISCPAVIPVSSFATWKTVTDASGDGRAQPGESLTYTIHVQNTGGVVLDSIIVRDTLPAHATYISGGSLTGNVVEFRDITPLDTGGRRTYSFTVQAATILNGVDSISNLAWVSGNKDTLPAGADSSGVCDTCLPVCTGCPAIIPVSSFVAWKTVADAGGDGKAQAGELLTYTIHIQNTGGTTLNDILVRDTLPAHTTYISGGVLTGNVIEFSDATPLDTGARRTYSFVVQAAATLAGVDSISNLAWVRGNNDTIPAGKDSTISCDTCPPPTCPLCPEVIPVSSFAAWKTVADAGGDGRINAGELLTYTIHVQNTGGVILDSIIISDTIPVHTSYVSGGVLTGNVVTFRDMIPLGTGEARAYNFIVQAAAILNGVDSISNLAWVRGGSDTLPAGKDSAVSCATCPVVMPVNAFAAWKTVADAGGNGKVNAGEQLTYTIHVQNTGGAALDGIVVRDTLPAHTSYISGGVLTGNVIEFRDLTPLSAGETRTYSFIVQATSVLTGIDSISNLAWVSGGGDTIPAGKDSVIYCDTCPPPTCPTCPVVIPASSFTTWKTVSDANGDGKVQPGEILTYVMHVKNTSASTIDNISIYDSVPLHTRYVPGSGGVLTGDIVSFTDAVPLAGGQTRSYSFKVLADAVLTGVNEIANQALVSADGDSVVTTADSTGSCLECRTVIPVSPVSNFITWKSVQDASGDGVAQPGEQLTYTIHVRNTGTDSIRNIIATDTIPRFTQFVGADGRGVYNATYNLIAFNVNSLAAGDTLMFTFMVTVNTDAPGNSTISNIAWTSADNIIKPTCPLESDACNGDTTKIPVNGEVNLAVKKVSDKTPTDINEPYNYIITVENKGPGIAHATQVTDQLPPQLTYISNTTTTGTVSINGQPATLLWNIDVLNPGDIVHLTLRVQSNKPDSVSNTVVAVSQEPDSDTTDNRSTDIKIITHLQIPNVLTPNGDGANDYFKIRGLELYPENQLVIFNRWSNKVYEKHNYANDWQGEGLNSGTYYYELRLKDKNNQWHQYKGYIMLLKGSR